MTIPPESRTAGRGAIRIPTWFVALCLAISTVNICVMFVGAWRTGVPWDEFDHIQFLQMYFETGWNTYRGTVDAGQPTTFSPWVAGPAFDLLAHAVASALGLETYGQPGYSLPVLEVRHLVVAVTSLLGSIVAAFIVGVLTHSRRWAIVGFTLLVTIPMWTGHGMFNNKDVPVALGYTSVTLAMILIAAQHRVRGPVRLGASMLLLAAGVTLAVGTRPGIWAPLAVTIGTGAGWLAIRWIKAQRSGRDWHPYATRVAWIVTGIAVAYVALLLIYPRPFSQPLLLLQKSLGESSNFAQDGQSRPWTLMAWLSTYIPHWLSMQLPLLQLGLLLVAIALAIVGAWHLLRGRLPLWEWRSLALILVFMQLAVAPVASVVLRSFVYDALRHFLFIIPAISIISTLALERLSTWIARRNPSEWLRRIVWGIVGVGLLLPTIDEVVLFPYGYAYVNEITTVRPLNGEVSTDYWRLSIRELIPKIPAEPYLSCQFRYTPDEKPSGNEWECHPYGSFVPFWDTQRAARADLAPGEFLFVESNRGLPYPPPNCEIIDRVTRTLHFQELTMSYVARCTRPS